MMVEVISLLVGDMASNYQTAMWSCRPFIVLPQTANVDVGALLQVNITYKPTCTGSHLTDLLVKYSVGL